MYRSCSFTGGYRSRDYPHCARHFISSVSFRTGRDKGLLEIFRSRAQPLRPAKRCSVLLCGPLRGEDIELVLSFGAAVGAEDQGLAIRRKFRKRSKTAPVGYAL